MKAVAQKARVRQAVIDYAVKYDVTNGANRYDVTGQYYLSLKEKIRCNAFFTCK